jgi:hypothetical protein
MSEFIPSIRIESPLLPLPLPQTRQPPLLNDLLKFEFFDDLDRRTSAERGVDHLSMNQHSHIITDGGLASVLGR